MRLKTLRLLFSLPKIPKHGAKERKKLRRLAVRRSSSGNHLLQKGRYITGEEIEAKKKALKAAF